MVHSIHKPGEAILPCPSGIAVNNPWQNRFAVLLVKRRASRLPFTLIKVEMYAVNFRPPVAPKIDWPTKVTLLLGVLSEADAERGQRFTGRSPSPFPSPSPPGENAPNFYRALRP